MAKFTQNAQAQKPVSSAALHPKRVAVVGKDGFGQAVMAFLKPKRATDLHRIGQLETVLSAPLEVEPYDCPDCRDMHTILIPIRLANGRQYEAAVLCHCQEADDAPLNKAIGIMRWAEAEAKGLLEGFKRA